MTGSRRYRQRRYAHLPPKPPAGVPGGFRADLRDTRPKILRVLGLAHEKATTPHGGRYVLSADPDAYAGRGSLETTDDVTEAKQFANVADALDYWQARSTIAPTRHDGKPNRPLTAYHVLILNAPNAHGDFGE